MSCIKLLAIAGFHVRDMRVLVNWVGLLQMRLKPKVRLARVSFVNLERVAVLHHRVAASRCFTFNIISNSLANPAGNSKLGSLLFDIKMDTDKLNELIYASNSSMQNNGSNTKSQVYCSYGS